MEAQQGGEKSSDGMERGKCNTLGLLKKKKILYFHCVITMLLMTVLACRHHLFSNCKMCAMCYIISLKG